jgi:hypothetical protein
MASMEWGDPESPRPAAQEEAPVAPTPTTRAGGAGGAVEVSASWRLPVTPSTRLMIARTLCALYEVQEPLFYAFKDRLNSCVKSFLKADPDATVLFVQV